MWIFDIERQQMWWANQAALHLWDAQSREELIGRNWSQMSDSTQTRLQGYLQQFQQGKTVVETWTFYPQVEAKSVQCICSGIRIESGRLAMLVEGNTEVMERIDSQTLRSIEALRHTTVMISLYNLDGSPVMQNPAAVRCYGDEENASEAREDTFYQRFVEGSIAQQARECISAREDFRTEAQAKTLHGIRWHAFDIRCTNDPVTAQELILVNETDVTKGKELEQQIQAYAAELQKGLAWSEDRFQRAFLKAPFPMIIHAEDGEILQVNGTWTQLTGYTHAEIPTISQWAQKAYGERQEIVRSYIDRLYELDERVDEGEFIIKTKDGSSLVWDFSSAPLGRLSDGRRTVVSIAKDVTERKRFEQELFAEKELAQVTLHSIGDAVITTDARGNISYVNPVAEQLTGWTYSEAKGQPVAEVFKITNELTRQPAENPVERVLREGQVVGLANHTVLTARDGTERPIDDSAAPIRDRNGQIIGVVLVFHDVTESRNLTHQLSWQATHDALTGLFNRREFEHRLQEAITAAKEDGKQHALCYLDLDQFKVVNDICGHIAGDELLRRLTTLLQQRVRSADILARLGGDEFGLLLYQCPLPQAEKIANLLREIVKNFRFAWKGRTFTVGVSIGLVAIDAKMVDLTAVLGAADAACYAAKERGRNHVHVYRENDAELTRQRGERQWIFRINQALEENRFRLYCQKIVPITGELYQNHFEVLLRMVDETGQLIPPIAFIPAAERYDLMPAIDRWVINHFFSSYESCFRAKNKRCKNLYAINLSAASVNNEGFLDFLKEQLNRYSIPPETLCWEITETTAIANLHQAVQFMNEIKQFGCSFALDDFGNGMSSLTYLKNLPVDYLKIDGSFVKNILGDRIDCVMVESFNQIGHAMGIKTVAEFVENDAISAKLRDLGVDYAQGYGIARPEPLTFV